MDTRYSLTHARSNYIIPIGYIYTGPAVNLNRTMDSTNEKIDNILLILAVIVTFTTPVLLCLSIALDWIDRFIR
jgi:hypothetical protein